MTHIDLYLDWGRWIVGDYSIEGNFADGYTVYLMKNGENLGVSYQSKSFEDCIVWCLG